jgi:hypothetical protein
VFQRPLVFVTGVTLLAYLLWTWAVAAGQGVVALVAGLSLVLLLAACVWLFALAAARVVARRTRAGARRRRSDPVSRSVAAAAAPRDPNPSRQTQSPATSPVGAEQRVRRDRSSGKIAA